MLERMKNRVMKTIVFASVCVTMAGSVFGQYTTHSGASRLTRPYATDYFEGFGPVDDEKRIPQKEPSFWFDLTYDNPKEQYDYARIQDADGSFRRARHAYEALIREWPASKEAPLAQYALAQMLERQGKLSKAFDEYQYLVTYYAGQCPFYDVLDKQFRIANALLDSERSMFGFKLNGSDDQRVRFETIARNAPRSPNVPELLLIIGSIRMAEKELEEAISVYDGLLNRFPESKQASAAAFMDAKCRRDLAVNYKYNEDRCRNSIAFFRALLERSPNHPEKAQLIAWQAELTNLLIEQNFALAVFYDTKQRNAEAAKQAYRRFIKEFPDSVHTPAAKERLAAIEAGAAPLRR